MTQEQQILWLAGLLEGEGSFCSTVRKARNCQKSRYTEVKIQLRMCDEDVVRHAAQIMGCNVHRYEHKIPKPGWNPYYSAVLQGHRAVAIMRAVLPFMGTRRKAAIEKALTMWENRRTIKDSVREQYANGMSDLHRKAIGDGMRGKKKSPEHAAKLRKNLKQYQEMNSLEIPLGITFPD